MSSDLKDKVKIIIDIKTGEPKTLGLDTIALLLFGTGANKVKIGADVYIKKEDIAQVGENYRPERYLVYEKK